MLWPAISGPCSGLGHKEVAGRVSVCYRVGMTPDIVDACLLVVVVVCSFAALGLILRTIVLTRKPFDRYGDFD